MCGIEEEARTIFQEHSRNIRNKPLSLYLKHRSLKVAYTYITGKLSNKSWTLRIQKDSWRYPA